MFKSQIDEISNLLIEYASGNYSKKGKVTEKEDEVDMIIQGINMLGEELQATSVSKDYFLSIYDAVTDLILVLDKKKKIIDVNNSVSTTFQIDRNKVINLTATKLIKESNSLIRQLEKLEDSQSSSISIETNIKFNNNEIIGLATCSKIVDRFGNHNGYLYKVKDITESKKMEKLVMQAIVKTEQSEQRRMADDLHDSLGQELSMTKLMLTNLEAYNDDKDENFIKLLDTSKNILDEAIGHLREICFDLMPSTLIKGGIDLALQEFVKKLNAQNLIEFSYESVGDFTDLNSEIEIIVFRITQEFVNNSIKHSGAKNVDIKLVICNKDELMLSMSDNGKGFNPKKLKPFTDGRGITNLQSKVQAFDGKYKLESKRNSGTKLEVIFPKIKV